MRRIVGTLMAVVLVFLSNVAFGAYGTYADGLGMHEFGARTDISGWDVTQGDMNIASQAPVIVMPAEGDSSMTAVAGASRPLRIQLSDAYANLTSDEGYEIYIIKNSDVESSPTKLDGVYKPGLGDYLYRVGTTDEMPSVAYIQTGVNKSKIYVKSMASGLQSDERSFSVTVSSPPSYSVDTVDGNYDFIEGDDVHILVSLDRQNTTGNSLFAFLVPVTDNDKAVVDCSFLARNGGTGLEIGRYNTSCDGYFTMIDGCSTASTSQFSYNVMLRTARVFEEGTEVTSYMCKNTLVLKSSNVIPTVDAVERGMDSTDEDGEFPDIVFPKDVEQSFTAIITEPGLADLQATGENVFKARWMFATTGVAATGPTNGDANGVIEGNPGDNPAKFTFTRAGRWTVTLQLKDKDMPGGGNGELGKSYVFYVDVIDQPSITVTGFDEFDTETDSFSETESGDAGGNAYINVHLDMNKCDFDMTVKLVVAYAGAANPGKFVLQTGSGIVQDPSDENVYYVTFHSGETDKQIGIKTLDGTSLSRVTITPSVTTHAIVPDSGTRYADEYYLGADKMFRVYNMAPVADISDFWPLPGTTNYVTIGAAEPITWDFTDVESDFTKGITVMIKGGGGYSATVYTAADAAGSFAPTFSSAGLQTVTMTIRDADNGSMSFIWYYNVEAAAELTAVIDGVTWAYTVSNGEASLGGRSSTAVYETTEGAISIPSSLGDSPVTRIGDDAFFGCSGLTSVAIPDSVTSIGSHAFFGCSGLTSVTIPDSVTNIGNSAFSGCSGLTSVTTPDSVTNIGDYAFYNCSGLTSVTIGNSVINIDAFAFGNCSNLTTVVMPDSVTSIGSYAFFGCSGLASVIFNGNAPAIGGSCFTGVPSSCVVQVNKDSTGWGVDIPGAWNGMRIEYLPMEPVAADASPTTVTNAIDSAGFADADGVKAAIGGSAEEYAAFKSWAGRVKGASGGAVAGESAVVANTNAAAAYLLGAERLFENAPKVEFEELTIGEDGPSDGTMTVSVTVKDGEDSVACSAEKVKSLFEATGNLGDWAGDAKLPVEVEVIGTSPMRFRVTPGDGSSPSAFLRIRK